MNLVVISHKRCWRSIDTIGYVTDGGFPLQMHWLSQLFDKTRILVPISKNKKVGCSVITGKSLEVIPLSDMSAKRLFARILSMMYWLPLNISKVVSEVLDADAVHVPVPSDIGYIGIFFALIFKKPLFIRHCGNFNHPQTISARILREFMIRFAGEKNVMMATGIGGVVPTKRNPAINWIFSTSLTRKELAVLAKSEKNGITDNINLIIVARQEKEKGTDVVLRALPFLAEKKLKVTLHVVGDGGYLEELKFLASRLGVCGNVIFYGHKAKNDVIELLKSSDIFCFPTSSNEGFPKAVLEAMAVGLPVVGSNISVLKHLINENCGVIVNTINPNNLSEAILKIMSNNEVFSRMSENCKKSASSYSIENWSHIIEEQLQKEWGELCG